MTRDDKIQMLGCGLLIALLFICIFIGIFAESYFEMPEESGFWIAMISFVGVIISFLLWGRGDSKQDVIKSASSNSQIVNKPPINEVNIPYILPYKSHCYNCKQTIHSSYNKYCEKCEHFKCNGCSRCFCSK